MPFGLTNAPAAFQSLMNDVFADYIDDFMVSYLDDILVYSDTLEDHIQHVSKVLDRLLSNHLFAKPEKCQFHQTKVEFLGFIISDSGISMNPEKVSAVTEWPIPKSVKEVQSFLGFANFYRKFISNFSEIVAPITNLLKKGNTFKWDKNTQKSFDLLKKKFTSTLILIHPDPARPFILETDASDFAISGVLSQYTQHSKKPHPIGFYSRKLSPAEINYDVHDKELLAIVDCLAHWRPFLLGANHPITIFTDHKNLVHWTTSKNLNRRQVRWSQFLADFNFFIHYRPGSLGGKPDALSRRRDYALKEDDIHVKQQTKALIPISKFDSKSFKTPTSKNYHNLHDDSPTCGASNDVTRIKIEPQTAEKFRLNVTTSTPENSENLIKRIQNAYQSDETIQQLINDLPEGYTFEDEILRYRNRIYVPRSMELEIIKYHHDHILAGHPGRNRTILNITQKFFFPSIFAKIKKYIQECDTCAKTRSKRHKPVGKLKVLPIPHRPFWSVSLDFNVGFPPVGKFNAILVLVCRFSKFAIFIPTSTDINAKELAELLVEHLFTRFGVPNNMISDRGLLFTSKFWRNVSEILKFDHNLSTAFHPQTDGQTERVNQELEHFLRCYLNFTQDNWVQLLQMANYAYNSNIHWSTGSSPFTTVFGYQPTFFPEVEAIDQGNLPSAQEFLQNRLEEWKIIKDQIRHSQDTMKEYADKKRSQEIEFRPGDYVYVEATNLPTQRPNSKLDFKRHGPLKVIKKISSHAYQIQRPDSWDPRIHDVFHVDLLTLAHVDPEKTYPAPPPVEIPGEDYPEYEVEKIVGEKIIRGQKHYLIKWKGYSELDNTYEHENNVSNAKSALKAYQNSRMRSQEGDTVRELTQSLESRLAIFKQDQIVNRVTRKSTRSRNIKK